MSGNGRLSSYPGDSFKNLIMYGQLADRLLVEHQVSCMQGEWEAALGTMERFFELRMKLMVFEEEVLLPEYRSNMDPQPAGGAFRFFIREHKLLRRDLTFFRTLISRKTLDPQDFQLDLVELFERYHRFKDLADHHDARDKNFLYAWADQFFTKVQRRELMQRWKDDVAYLLTREAEIH